MYANYQRNDGPDWVTVGDMRNEIEHAALSGGYIFLTDYHADPVLLDLMVQMERDHRNFHHRYCS